MKSVKRRSAPTVFVDPAIFKSYDIRGIVPEQLNPEVAHLIGRAYAAEIKGLKIAVGRDMRTHSDSLREALVDGLIKSGCHVIDVGRVSTDALYFAVGHLECDGGIMITASHNPAEYNGFKMCRANAEPISGSEGLNRMQDTLELDDYHTDLPEGSQESHDVLPEFAKHVLSFVDPAKMKKLKIVIDAGNGMGGVVVPAVMESLPIEVIEMYFEPDGTFPNHPANPIEPKNLKDLIARVKSEKADLGVAFDGDADRMFLVDETGKPLGGDIATMLVARSLLAKNPGATILFNLICSRAVPELIAREGGKAVRTPVGHSIIKQVMKKEGALFGGEHSGHFYFQKNWYADSGLIAMLLALEALSEVDQPLSELVAMLDPYHRSGEINVKSRNIPKSLDKVVQGFKDGRADFTDGVTVSYEDWWFNARPSGTEPLLRLNVEANSAELLKEKTAAVLALVRGRRKVAV